MSQWSIKVEAAVAEEVSRMNEVNTISKTNAEDPMVVQCCQLVEAFQPCPAALALEGVDISHVYGGTHA